MKIKYFAWIRDITKNDEEELDSSKINNLEKLKFFIINKYPDLKKHLENDFIRFAVNQEYVHINIDLNATDEVAIFPPVSGG